MNLGNIKGFLQGNFRKILNDLGLEDSIPEHIQEQIQWRIGVMNIECYKNKECPCQCSVPAKQFEDRPCENLCYPEMMNETDWRDYKNQHNITHELILNNLHKKELLENGHSIRKEPG